MILFTNLKEDILGTKRIVNYFMIKLHSWRRVDESRRSHLHNKVNY
jgi:hypothetical protein